MSYEVVPCRQADMTLKTRSFVLCRTGRKRSQAAQWWLNQPTSYSKAKRSEKPQVDRDR